MIYLFEDLKENIINGENYFAEFLDEFQQYSSRGHFKISFSKNFERFLRNFQNSSQNKEKFYRVKPLLKTFVISWFCSLPLRKN